jgi:hypothetical protein
MPGSTRSRPVKKAETSSWLRADADQDAREGLHDLLGRRPVDREVVLAARSVFT